MANNNTNFTITKGIKNEFIVTIKKDDSLLPLVIDSSDSFSLKLINRDSEIVEYTINSIDDTNINGFISIDDANNGKIKIIMESAMTSLLKKERGHKADRYYLKPTYKLLLECNTLNNGVFPVVVHDVYVD